MPDPLVPAPDFLAASAAAGIAFDPGDLEALGRYLALLLETNRQFNLTAIEDPAVAWTKHILDSLTLLPILGELPAGAKVIDVGSGGGLPGVPLAIVLPRLRFTLLEATGKKADFLRRVVAALTLGNVEVVQDRAERIGRFRGERTTSGGKIGHQAGHREGYDGVIARAVGRLATIAELCVPLARAGGRVLLIKGQKAGEELAEAAKALSLLRVEHSGTVETPTGRIVVLDKAHSTPRAYPRQDGEPKRAPLGVAALRDTGGTTKDATA
jgi:16S rRNA (guanine527-N7)-methyltransferase